MEQAGTYILVLSVNRETEISIGQLGTFAFPNGHYLYIGSARGPGGLKARLARHLRESKQPRWHIDYLLQEARVVEIWKASSPEKLECLWAQALLTMPNATILVSGFGSSDCGCPTHLIYFTTPTSFPAFASQLQALGAGPCLAREMPGEATQG